MIQLLRNMEYRHTCANSMIFEELDDINEVIFIQKGIVDIGYQMNKSTKYVVRYENKTLIGGYNCTFNMRIIFCYKARSDCEGSSIRKHKWMHILEEFPELGDLVKRNVEIDYFKNIKNKVMAVKERHL